MFQDLSATISRFGYKLFPNASTGVARLGCFLFGAGALGCALNYLLSPKPTFPVDLGYAVMALIGLVAISTTRQLKNLERRLDRLEGEYSG